MVAVVDSVGAYSSDKHCTQHVPVKGGTLARPWRISVVSCLALSKLCLWVC